MSRILKHPASTHALFVAIALGTTALLALSLGQLPTLAVGAVTVLLAVGTNGLLGAEESFTYRTLSGVFGTLALSVAVPVTLAVSVVAGVSRYDGLGIALSSVAGLLLVGALGLTLWRAVQSPKRNPSRRVFVSLLVWLGLLCGVALLVFFMTNPWAVLSPFVADPAVVLEGTFLATVAELAAVPFEYPALWAAAVTGLAVLDAYLLRFLLARPLVVRVRVWAREQGRKAASRTAEAEPSSSADEQTSEDSPAWLDDRLPSGVPFWHYTPVFAHVAAAVSLVIIGVVFGTVLSQAIGNWPATQDVVFLARLSLESLTATLESVAGPPSVVFDATMVAVVLTAALVVESVLRRFVHSGWRGYVGPLGWAVPPVAVAGLAVATADPLVAWLLDTPALHYYVVARDGVLLSVESDFVGIERFDPAALDVTVVRSSELFVPLVEDLAAFYGDPVLLLAPVIAVVCLATCLLAVGRWLALPALRFTADRADVSVLLLMAALVLAALAGGDELLLLAACGGIFLLVDVDGMAQQYRVQFDANAAILRGQFVHVLGVSLVLAAGVVLAWLSGRPSLRSVVADLPRWRVLGGLVLAMALVSLVLYVLRASVAVQEPQATPAARTDDRDGEAVDVADD